MNLDRMSTLERFERQYIPEPNSGCWIWLGALSTVGYARISIDGKPTPAHRFAYEAYIGPVAEGLELDHTCRMRCCVNPSHLEAVTHQENCRRGVGSATHCKRGHPFSKENTYHNGRQRFCQACRLEGMAKWRKQNAAR